MVCLVEGVVFGLMIVGILTMSGALIGYSYRRNISFIFIFSFIFFVLGATLFFPITELFGCKLI